MGSRKGSSSAAWRPSWEKTMMRVMKAMMPMHRTMKNRFLTAFGSFFLPPSLDLKIGRHRWTSYICICSWIKCESLKLNKHPTPTKNNHTYTKKKLGSLYVRSNISNKHTDSNYKQSFQPPYHFIVLPRAFHSIFFHLIVFFIEKNVFALILKIAYSNTRT